VELQTSTVSVMPGMQPTMTPDSDSKEHGLVVNYEFGNDPLRPLDRHDISAILQKGNSYWPKLVIDFLNRRKIK
jgi:hypothetical protein